mgnify:FL=1
MDQIVHQRPAPIRSLDAELSAIVEEHRGLERNAKQLALRLLDLMARHAAEGRVGFYGWIESAGLPRATAHRYIHAALAIRNGLDPDGSRGLTELADLGQALQRGTPLEELASVKSPDEAATLAEAARNHGVVKIRITADYKTEWQQLVGRTIDVFARSGVEMVEPDAAGLLVMRVNAMTSRLSDDQFRQWIEGSFQIGTAGQRG